MSTSSLPLLLCDQLKQRCQSPFATNEAGIVEVMRALQTCDMTVELLQSTKVGVLLNTVRRELSEEGAAVAKQLIAQWKEVARSGTANSTTTTIVSSSAMSASAPTLIASSSPAAATGDTTTDSAVSSSPTRSASDALRASSERRKRKAADMSRSVSPDPPRPAYTLSDLPSLAYSQLALSPAKAATYYSDTASHALPLYNPNHHSQQPQSAAAANGHSAEGGDESHSGGADAEDDSGKADADIIADMDLTAKFKRQHMTDVDLAGSHLPLPTSAVAVCSLQQMCVDHLAQPAVVNQLGSLPPLPQPLLLAILQRASVDCLRRVQAGSGWIKEADLDELWKAAAVRRWGKQEVREEEERRSRAKQQQTRSSWKAYYEKKEKEKENKLSQLGQRLKARVEEEKRDKKERQGIKTMDFKQATKQLEKRGKKQPTSAAASGGNNGGGGGVSRSNSGGHSSVSADKRADKPANRLSALRKETGSVSQKFWSARPND